MPLNKVQTLLSSMGPALLTNRKRVAAAIIENPSLFPALMQLSFETDYKLHHKAMWTLEIILDKNIEQIIPYINYFTENIHKLRKESAKRPAAKICKWIAEAYVKEHSVIFHQQVEKSNIEQIVNTAFDWIITDTKVATKVYSMDVLYYFGSLTFANFNWIHTELKNIIIENTTKESVAFEAHAKHTLKLLN